MRTIRIQYSGDATTTSSQVQEVTLPGLVYISHAWLTAQVLSPSQAGFVTFIGQYGQSDLTLAFRSTTPRQSTNQILFSASALLDLGAATGSDAGMQPILIPLGIFTQKNTVATVGVQWGNFQDGTIFAEVILYVRP